MITRQNLIPKKIFGFDRDGKMNFPNDEKASLVRINKK